MRHFISLMCVLALGLTGCGKIIEMLTGKGGNPPGTATPGVPGTPGTATPGVPGTPGTTTGSGTAAPAGGDAQEQTDQLLSAKLDGYITDCINNYSGPIRGTHERYALWVNMETGPTGREGNIYGLYQLNRDGADCVAAVARAAGLEPRLPELEQAAQAYAAAVQAVVPVVGAAYQYYERENYKDDAFARGKELHPQLVQAFQAFNTANDALVSQIETLKDQLDEREIVRARANPARELEARVLGLHLKAKRIANIAQGSEIGNDLKLTHVDIAALTTLATEFETETDQLKTYSAAHSQDWSNSNGSSFLSNAEDFAKAAKNMMRRARDGEPFDRFRAQHNMLEHEDGAPQNIISEFNDLVQSLNSMRFPSH